MFHEVSWDPISGRLHDRSNHVETDIAQQWWALRAHLNSLPVVERRVLRWLGGIDEASLSADEIAMRLNMTIDQVWQIAERGLAQIGLLVLSETPLLSEEAA